MARKSIVVPLSRDEALELARNAVEDSRLQLRDVRVTSTGVRAKTGISLRSFGSSVRVTAVDDENGTKLTVTVGPAAPALTDWGRSDEEAQSIISAIRRSLRDR